MNKNIKVSIIVPVYNVEEYLNRCIDSLLKQTLKEIEIILVDDGSTDSSPQICDEYEKNNSNIKVLHLENGRPARARNKGIEIAQGEYIGFADSDDYCHVEQFEKLYQNAKDNNSDIAMCSFFVDSIKGLEPIIIPFKQLYNSNEEIKNSVIKCFYGEYVHGLNSLWIKIFKRSMLLDNKIKMDESLMRAEDMWFIFDALKVSNVFSFISDNLYYYYQNDSSIMHDSKNDSYEHWVNNRKRLLKENEELGFELDNNSFYKDFIYMTIMFCRDKIKANEFDVFKAVINDDFLNKVAKYRKLLPLHIKLLAFLLDKKMYRCFKLALLIWNTIKG
ncbi:glycosyltransferase [Eubacterium sp.]